jgi:hypothetical protein
MVTIVFLCVSDQQLQILEILQNNGEQLFPDEHGEVEIEIAKCCLGSVKQACVNNFNLFTVTVAKSDIQIFLIK